MKIERPTTEICLCQITDDKDSGNYSVQMVADLGQLLEKISQESNTKVLILTGSRKVFQSGASAELLHRLSEKEMGTSDLLPMMQMLLDCPIPIIAAMEGHAVGGGLIFALYCDFVIAAREMRYGLNFSEFGITPGLGATELLPQLVGPHFAMEMLATARLYKGKDLESRGLFNAVLPQDKVLDAAMNLAKSLAERPRYLLSLLKSSLSAPKSAALRNSAENERAMHLQCFSQAETLKLLKESSHK